MTKSEANVDIGKHKITKKFKKTKDGRIFFQNELSIYLLAKQENLSYIPKLISYSMKNQTLIIERRGKSLDYIPEEDWEGREKHLKGISKIYKSLERYKLYHNDLRYKNILYDKKTKKYYLIDFESVSYKNTEADGDFIIRNIQKKIIKKSKTKKKSNKSKK
jgi:predicted Ser/Thr protein kinase